MHLLLLITALITCMYLVVTIIEFIFGFNKIKNLAHQPIMPRDQLPGVTIIFSALNEESEIEKALTSMLNLDYPNLEIIAINDRSSDTTPDILKRLESQHPRLRVFDIHQLPKGWFGKNHALHFASHHANGEWILFTDADVSMKPDTMLKAISYVLNNQLQHLTMHELHHRKHFWLKVLLLGNYVSQSIAMRPWRISYRWSKKSVGFGAFNLIHKETYEKCGGHQAIAMECLDDLKLGELVKKNNFRQDIVNGQDNVEREWYNSAKNMIHGLKKNSFAYYNYQIMPAFRDLIFGSLFYFFPLIAAVYFTGPIRWINILNVCLTLFMSAYAAKQHRLKKYYAFFYPVAIAILIYTVWNSVVATYRNKGVIWRGTHYSLKMLKSEK